MMPGRDIIERITLLTEKEVTDGLSEEESAELQLFFTTYPGLREGFAERTDPQQLEELLGVYLRAKAGWKDKFEAAHTSGKLKHRTTGPRKTLALSWQRVMVAAAVVIFIAVGAVLVINGHKMGKAPVVARLNAGKDLPPGSNKAILTLTDGSSVTLDSGRTGALPQQGGSRVIILTDGQLGYKVEDEAMRAGYNTITTPAGGTYQVHLSDGTVCWLNAASSIRYPTVFSDKVREVTITGEVYLDVAKDTRRPFHVLKDKLDVTVLGTSFDISAYPGEPVKTTLVEGAVKVSQGQQQMVLSPGQQASAETSLTLIPHADVEEATAWKEGLFVFNNATIESVMNSLSRWYNVEVRYEGPRTTHRISSVIRRDSYASQSLEILEASGYHFRIEGNTIIVLP